MIKYIFSCLVICFLIAGTVIETETKVFSAPREDLIEGALLQQLHPVIVSSLREIYNEKYSQFENERIISINERVTVKNKDINARAVDAIHGAKYFEITIMLSRPNSEMVELILSNEKTPAHYYLVNYKILRGARFN